MLTMCWEVCYKTLVYKSKLPQIRSSTFLWVQFSEKGYLLIKEHYGYFIFFIKFNYLIGPNILQLVFSFITYSVAA